MGCSAGVEGVTDNLVDGAVFCLCKKNVFFFMNIISSLPCSLALPSFL